MPGLPMQISFILDSMPETISKVRVRATERSNMASVPETPPAERTLLAHPKRLQRFSPAVLRQDSGTWLSVRAGAGVDRTLGKTQLVLGNSWHHPWSHDPPLWLEVVWYEG